MKITKIKTKFEEMQVPVSTDLDAVAERMRSDRNKEAALVIARNAMSSRLLIEQGGPRCMLGGIDALPRLLFAATFGRGGLDDPKTLTGLLLLTVYCPDGQQQVNDARRRVAQVPYTLMAFAGVSGVTLKVVVRCRYDYDESRPDVNDYLLFLRDAQRTAVGIYQTLANVDFCIGEQTLDAGCRMSHDPKLYYQPEASVMPVVRQDGDPLKPYEGTRVEDDGEVVWFPDDDDRKRVQLEYQACLGKALDEEPDDAEHCVQTLADYCVMARLPEEGCVVRTQWQSRFRDVHADVVRKIFRNAYRKPYEGRTLTQMNEKERIMRSIESFLQRRYQLRFNVVKQMVEFRPNDLRFKPWEPLGDRQLKSLVVEEMKEGGESWMNDIRTYIESAHVNDYNPVHEFLAGVGEWDRKHNYIEDFARRLPTAYDRWPQYFHRWLLAMVAQALDKNRDYGNSMVPMLIGPQGYKKSSFCKAILPPSMREYYMDDIKMDNAEQVERVLGRMWLVNIDEYNAKTDREQAKIKRLLTEKDVQVRRMRSDQYTMTSRLCSFIATTNDPQPLPSGDGSRRYLCVEVTGQVDMGGRIPYKQMYAQAVSELRDRDTLYWFTSEDERDIQEHNRHYQQQSSPEMVLAATFEPAPQHTKDTFWQVIDMQRELSRRLKAADVPSLKLLGQVLKKMNWPHGSIKGIRGYYIQLRKQS